MAVQEGSERSATMEPDRPRPRRTRLANVLRGLGLLTAAGFVYLLFYGLAARSPNTTIDDALAGHRAPAAPGFRLAVLADGQPGPLSAVWRRAARDHRVALAELRGTPVVLNFWASWCDPCREEAPVLERGWRAARPRGVLFVGLDQQDVREDARAFMRHFGQDFPMVRDPANATSRRWGVTGIPETFFITRNGRVVGHVIGTVTPRQLADGVTAALTGRPRAAHIGGDQLPAR